MHIYAPPYIYIYMYISYSSNPPIAHDAWVPNSSDKNVIPLRFSLGSDCCIGVHIAHDAQQFRLKCKLLDCLLR